MSHRQRRARLERRRGSAGSIGARAVGVGSGALAVALIPVGSAQAADTFTVSNLNDTGNGSLRQAMSDAQSAGGDDTIVFASGLSGDIALQSPLPPVTENLDIQGPGARVVTLDASGLTGTGNVIAASGPHALTIGGLTMENAPSGHDFVYASGAALTLDADTFSGNRDISADARGYGNFTINDSTFSANSYLPIFGGYGETTAVTDSAIAGNSGPYGGGIVNYNAHLAITDSTITGNANAVNANPVCYAAVTTSGYNYGDVTVQDTIVAGNTQQSTCTSNSPDILVGRAGSLSTSFSLIENTTGLPSGDLNSTDLTDVSPDLGPLQNNGGPTNTELPNVGSPVINAGKAFGQTVDQRGLARTVEYPGVANRSGGDGTDMGAAELQLPPTVSQVSPAKTPSGYSVTITGINVGQATEVMFGNTKATTFHATDSDHLTAVVPVGSGTVDVRVLTPDGESATSKADHFTFEFLTKSGKSAAHWKGKEVVVAPGIKVLCPKLGKSCHTTVTAHSKVKGVLSKKTKNLLVGSAHITTNAGGQHTITFKLNRKGLNALKRLGHLRITVHAKATDTLEQATLTKTITIRLPKKH